MDLDSNETALFIERSDRDASAITSIMALLDIDEYLSIFVFTWGTNVTSPRLPWIPASAKWPNNNTDNNGSTVLRESFQRARRADRRGEEDNQREKRGKESGGGDGGGVNTQLVISEVALALFTHPQPHLSFSPPPSRGLSSFLAAALPWRPRNVGITLSFREREQEGTRCSEESAWG